MKTDPFRGTRIPRRLWPREYLQKYYPTNLWKCNLPGAWRLVYTVVGTEVEIVSVILEWFDYKNYEKRFKYNVK